MQTERIVKECLKGNEGAWQMLVNTYSRRIFSLAYQFSGTREEAEDMTQEIFLKLHHSLKKFDFDKNFDAWLLTLARNHLIDEYRRSHGYSPTLIEMAQKLRLSKVTIFEHVEALVRKKSCSVSPTRHAL